MDSSAATSTCTPSAARRSRSSTSSSTVAHGCSTYSRPGPSNDTGPVPGARETSAARTAWSRTRTAWAASATDHAPLASTRTRAPGRACRTAATRATSSTRCCPFSATLTLTVIHPGKRSRIAATSPAGTAGTVALTGTRERTGGGGPCHAISTAEASQWAASGSWYSPNGPNSPHPAGPSIRTSSRSVMPRNRTRIGRATTWTRASRSSIDSGPGTDVMGPR